MIDINMSTGCGNKHIRMEYNREGKRLDLKIDRKVEGENDEELGSNSVTTPIDGSELEELLEWVHKIAPGCSEVARGLVGTVNRAANERFRSPILVK